MVRIPQDIQLLVSVTKLANKLNRNSAVVEPVETWIFRSRREPDCRQAGKQLLIAIVV
jgi:hypothetical protein